MCFSVYLQLFRLSVSTVSVLIGREQNHAQPEGRHPAKDAIQGATGPTGVCMIQ